MLLKRAACAGKDKAPIGNLWPQLIAFLLDRWIPASTSTCSSISSCSWASSCRWQAELICQHDMSKRCCMLCSNHSNGNGSGTAAHTMLDMGTASRACLVKLYSNEALSQKLFCHFLPQAGDYNVQVSPELLCDGTLAGCQRCTLTSWCSPGPAGGWQAVSVFRHAMLHLNQQHSW